MMLAVDDNVIFFLHRNVARADFDAVAASHRCEVFQRQITCHDDLIVFIRRGSLNLRCFKLVIIIVKQCSAVALLQSMLVLFLIVVAKNENLVQNTQTARQQLTLILTNNYQFLPLPTTSTSY